jgi:hypothetical protein
MGESNAVIASEAKQSRATQKDWIASSQVLLAMTAWDFQMKDDE